MGIGDWIVTVILFIVALASLIVIHELGHFLTAKAFNVYCHEFSIGFGPALFKKKPKGKETYISIRAVPLGGYVSMFGEDDNKDEKSVYAGIPESRSIEGIKKWKKAIVLGAGIVLNAILAFILIVASDVFFPVTSSTSTMEVEENSIAYKAGFRSADSIMFLPSDRQVGSEKGPLDVCGYYIVDDDIEIESKHYVLTYHITNIKKNSQFGDGLILFEGLTENEVKADENLKAVYENWYLNEDGSNKDSLLTESPLNYYPDIRSDDEGNNHIFNPLIEGDKVTSFTADVGAFVYDLEAADWEETPTMRKLVISSECTNPNEKNETKREYKWANNGISFINQSEYLPAKVRWSNAFKDYGNGAIAIFKGLGTLFSGGIKNLSGIIGILQTSAQIYETSTASYYIYFWGLISLNLAVFNLLPLPGLDGFQLLITVIEGISKKKIPNKVKTILSLIGIGLLLLLMAVIIVLDVLRWIGVAI